MDIASLVAGNLPAKRPSRCNASDEERYWHDQTALPRPNLRLIGSLAATAGVILLLIGAAQV